MGFYDVGGDRLSLLDVFTIAVLIVIFIIIISVVVLALSPLDLGGYLKRSVPMIVTVVALLVALAIVLIVAVFVPDVITRR